MKFNSLILLYLFLFLCANHALAENEAPWEETRKMREERGGNFASEWVKKGLEKARGKAKDQAWEIYREIQRTGTEELVERKAGHWETAQVIVWRELKELLEKRGDLLKNVLDIVLDIEISEEKLERLYEAIIRDGQITPYEAFAFSWYAAPYLPTRMGGYLLERMGDALLEQGGVVRAYGYYKSVWNHSAYRVTRKDFTEKVEEKLKKLERLYGDILFNKIEKAPAMEGIELSDGTRYRLVLGETETWEPDLFLEISFPEKVIRRKIYDFDGPTHLLPSKKHGVLFIRWGDKLLLAPQVFGSLLIFDLNGMLLEKKPITKEIASRYEIKEIHEFLFSKNDFVLIPKGTFNMGSPPHEEGRKGEETLHAVKITKDFYLQRTEVTQLQWYLVMGESPSYFKERKDCEEDWDEELGICPNHPVEQVSWNDIQAFIQKINEIQSEYVYRLPTEAEWEYAARAGTQDAYSFGDNAALLSQFAWFSKNAGGQTQSVAQKKPNEFGLFDMYGNVWEWVSDWHDNNYGLMENQLRQTVEDPQGPSSGSSRVVRGGGWDGFPRYLRSAYRSSNFPDYRNYGRVGGRLLRQK